MNPEPPIPPEDPIPEGEDVLDLDMSSSDVTDLQSLADNVAKAEEASARHRETVKAMQDAARSHLETQLAEAERRIAELTKRGVETEEQQRRLAADFNNFRNRAQRDIQLAVDQAEKKVFLELLPVLDSFERGLESTYPDLATFHGGVELIRKQYIDALRRLGVEALPVQVGDPFDALHAEALTTLERPELPDGSVAAVYEKGYNLRGLLLRPARVVVNRLPQAGKFQTQQLPDPPLDGTESAEI